MEMKDAPTPALTPFYLSQVLYPESAHLQHTDEGYFDSKRPGPAPLGWTSSDLRSDLAPIDSIPTELTSHILELAYFSENPPDDAFRRAISQISSHFRRITMTTPSLWSKYHLTQGNISEYLPYLPHYLELSKGYPLDIQLSCFWPADLTERVLCLFLPHSHRWRHLSVVTPNAEIFPSLADVSAPILETLSLSHFSSERRLHLRLPIFGGRLLNLTRLLLHNISLDRVTCSLRNLTSLELRGYGTWPQFSGLHEMLAGSEALRSLVLHVKPSLVLHDIQRQPDQDPILLPALRMFTVFTSEWLTEDIARLIRTFDFPDIETLLVQEGSGLESTYPWDIVRYSASPLPFMNVVFADVPTALRCLPPGHLAKLNTLELKDARWKDLPFLQTTFRTMASLEKLTVRELNPHNVLADLDAHDSPPCITIPSLRTLDVDVGQNAQPYADVSHFIRLLILPSLSSLVLRHLSKAEWESTVAYFTTHIADYPHLTSLTVSAMHWFAAPHSSPSPAAAFPYLRSLTILAASSNLFLSYLASPSSHLEDGAVPWPDLETITICGDTLASKPLLHRAIAARQAAGKPFVKLFLDGTFRSNLDSWEWISERVEVVEVL